MIPVIGAARCVLLALLADRRRAVPSEDLAARAGYTSRRVRQVLPGLIASGYVERCQGLAGGAVGLSLTQIGRLVAHKAAK